MIYIKDRFDSVEDGIKYLINTLVNHYYNDLCGGRSYMFTDRRVLKMTKLETDSWDYRQTKKYFIILHNNIPWGYIVNIDDDNKFNKGDLLMPRKPSARSGFYQAAEQRRRTPTRNFSRGNILHGNFHVANDGPARFLRQ